MTPRLTFIQLMIHKKNSFPFKNTDDIYIQNTYIYIHRRYKKNISPSKKLMIYIFKTHIYIYIHRRYKKVIYVFSVLYLVIYIYIQNTYIYIIKSIQKIYLLNLSYKIHIFSTLYYKWKYN